MQEPSQTKIATPSRKGKEREPDIADKIIALRRKQAAIAVPRERPERTQPSTSSRPTAMHPSSPRRLHAPPVPSPNIVVSEASPSHMDADPEDFSRRLKISYGSPRASHARPAANGSPGKLYNPNTDPVRRPAMTAEPEAMSDGASSSHSPRAAPSRAQPSQPPRGAQDAHRQLFDPRKHDAVLFSSQHRHHGSSAPPNPSTNAGRPTPTPKSSGDWVSASSTSSVSYAHSTISSNFTLSSATTDSSSASSALFDTSNPSRKSEDSASSANAFSRKLKEVYRTISGLESRLLGSDREREHTDDSERGAHRPGVLIKGRPASTGAPRSGASEEEESERWRKLVSDHRALAESIREMLALTLAPTVPASLKNIPQKYNLIIRLWSHAFYHLLESLRHAARPPTTSPVALEYLQQFLNYAYVFYGGLFEERNYSQYRGAFLEALGDLSRYWMAVSALVEGTHIPSNTLTSSAVAKNNLLVAPTPRPSTPNATTDALDLPSNAVSPTPARIDDSPQSSEAEMPVGVDAIAGGAAHMQNIPSVGQEAARLMELDPDKERWRQVAKEWFARGLAITPNSGKLQHHLGLLCRDKDGTDEELRGVYHFVKSMVAFHPFSTARESVLAMWSPTAQARRQAPDARLSELFVCLHGMLFTNIQLDDFKLVLERFREKLEIGDGEQVEEREWIMMALINIGSLFEYGRPTAVLRRVAGIESRAPGAPGASPVLANSAQAGRLKVLMAKRLDGDLSKMEIDDEDVDIDKSSLGTGEVPSPTSAEPELPAALQLAMELTFVMLSHTLRNPIRRASEYATPTLNPYNTVILTFLATVLRDQSARAALERSVPWEDLASFLSRSIPRRDILREHQKVSAESGILLTSGCKPLPEDWCIRGMGWGGKKVFERGFWTKDSDTAGDERNIEVEVLDRVEIADQAMDGLVEDEDDGANAGDNAPDKRRWVRLTRAGLRIARDVHGFKFTAASPEDGRPCWRVEGALAAKVARWSEEERLARDAEEQRMRGTRWEDDSMEVDDVEGGQVDDDLSEDAEDNEQDPEEIRRLKARRRYLQALLESGQHDGASPSRRSRGSPARKTEAVRQSLQMVAGYTVLVVDTNILLSSLSEFSALVESGRWTLVVPLPVVMELDSQSSNATPLGQAAGAALQYISTHVRSHATSLKVLTSRGNYLSNLNVRTEQIDFTNGARNMDDLILRAALWQDEHWVDRSALLRGDDSSSKDTSSAAKVSLLSFDRMLRLKARSRQLYAANEQDLARILAAGT
ncbi:Telomerase-binding protein EST1A [Trametes pubescens]|uniref:Telomerase-binding protein EST1A n=1 Tax=Trametes pubescens TaxID=154538 RepID=A0A1M2W2Q9_TRAPU|nr:Telomerase-binding protein EST1A [Trametes pubescens]